MKNKFEGYEKDMKFYINPNGIIIIGISILLMMFMLTIKLIK